MRCVHQSRGAHWGPSRLNNELLYLGRDKGTRRECSLEETVGSVVVGVPSDYTISMKQPFAGGGWRRNVHTDRLGPSTEALVHHTTPALHHSINVSALRYRVFGSLDRASLDDLPSRLRLEHGWLLRER